MEPNDTEFRRKVAECYVQGLAWVLCYYYQGVRRVLNQVVINEANLVEDSIVAMVLSIPFRTIRGGFRRC